MSFIDSAAEVLERAEGSLQSLITDALKAKAYGEVSTIAAMAQAVAAISTGRGRDTKRPGADMPVSSVAAAPAETPKAVEPSWMRPKTP